MGKKNRSGEEKPRDSCCKEPNFTLRERVGEKIQTMRGREGCERASYGLSIGVLGIDNGGKKCFWKEQWILYEGCKNWKRWVKGILKVFLA